jgi:hypothetical protein
MLQKKQETNNKITNLDIVQMFKNGLQNFTIF